MPVTAKLSRSFYDKLGDDVASELVDWFNAVDTDYKNDLRELNDRNWDRVRAEMAAQRSEFHTDVAAQRADLRGEIAKLRADVIKWMFIFWSGTVVPIVGLLIAVITLIE